jgi:hypothetical protein
MKSSTIIQRVIEEINSDPMVRNKDNETVIVIELCKKIAIEQKQKLSEREKKILEDCGPQGANIFLTLPIPFQKNPKEVSYLTIEHDPLSAWSVCYYVDFGATGQNKLKRRHDITAFKPNHILTQFAKIYKLYLGKEAENL